MKYVMKQISPDHIKNASTKELLELWELTKRMKCSEESSIVRGWLVDELETRDPESIGAWKVRICMLFQRTLLRCSIKFFGALSRNVREGVRRGSPPDADDGRRERDNDE